MKGNVMSNNDEEQVIPYNDTLRDELKEALVAAFPTVPLFRDMIHKTKFNFESIVSYNANLPIMVIDIISYASTQGEIEHLVEKAVSVNYNNSKLRQFAQKIGVVVPNGPVNSIYSTASLRVPPTASLRGPRSGQPPSISPRASSGQQVNQSASVFISNSLADQQWVEQNVCQRLRRNTISYDGPDLRQEEERARALRQASKIVLIISRNFFQSAECMHDLQILAQFQAEAIKEKIIRVQFQNIDAYDSQRISFLTASIFYYNLVSLSRDAVRLAGRLDELIKVIRGESVPPMSKPLLSHPRPTPSRQPPPDQTKLSSGNLRPAPDSPNHPSSFMTLFTGSTGTHVTWSSNAKKVAFAAQNGTVSVWDVENKSVLSSWNIGNGAINAIALSPEGDRVAIATNDKTISIWNVMGKQLQDTYKGHQAVPTTIAWSFDGNTIASADGDSNVYIWNPTTPGRTLKTFSRHQQPNSTTRYPIHALAWAHNNEDIISASYGKVYTWHAQSGSVKGSIDINNYVPVISWSPNDSYIAISNNGNIEVHFANGGSLQSIHQHTQARNDDSKEVSIDTITWSPDSKHLVAGGANTNLLLWQIDNGNKVHEYPHSQDALAVIWSTYLFSIGTGNRVMRWNHAI